MIENMEFGIKIGICMSGKPTAPYRNGNGNGTVTKQCDWLIGIFAILDRFRIKPFEWCIGVFAHPDRFRIKPFECHRTDSDTLCLCDLFIFS